MTWRRCVGENDLVQLLAVPAQRAAAIRELVGGLGATELRWRVLPRQAMQALIDGLRDPHSQVRWRSVQLIDHLPDDRALDALVPLLEDAVPRVRRNATHTHWMRRLQADVERPARCVGHREARGDVGQRPRTRRSARRRASVPGLCHQSADSHRPVRRSGATPGSLAGMPPSREWGRMAHACQLSAVDNGAMATKTRRRQGRGRGNGRHRRRGSHRSSLRPSSDVFDQNDDRAPNRTSLRRPDATPATPSGPSYSGRTGSIGEVAVRSAHSLSVA